MMLIFQVFMTLVLFAVVVSWLPEILCLAFVGTVLLAVVVAVTHSPIVVIGIGILLGAVYLMGSANSSEEVVPVPIQPIVAMPTNNVDTLDSARKVLDNYNEMMYSPNGQETLNIEEPVMKSESKNKKTVKSNVPTKDLIVDRTLVKKGAPVKGKLVKGKKK